MFSWINYKTETPICGSKFKRQSCEFMPCPRHPSMSWTQIKSQDHKNIRLNHRVEVQFYCTCLNTIFTLETRAKSATGCYAKKIWRQKNKRVRNLTNKHKWLKSKRTQRTQSARVPGYCTTLRWTAKWSATRQQDIQENREN